MHQGPNFAVNNCIYPVRIFHNDCVEDNGKAPISNLLPTKIHINPRICASRSIYINKALYHSQSNSSANSALIQKNERVHYNPHFFKTLKASIKTNENATTDLVAKKEETKIHINPKFIKNKTNSIYSQSVLNTNIPVIKNGDSELNIFDKPSVGNEIHINPIFFNDLKNERILECLNDASEGTSDLSNTPKQRYVTKYKVIRKKISPTVINDPSSFRKSNLKKINQTPIRKNKFKIVKGNCLKYVNHQTVDQKYSSKNKYQFRRSTSKANIDLFVNKTSTHFPIFSQNALTSKFRPANKSKYSLSLINRKSILQMKIEARRRVKSSINQYSTKTFPFKSRYKYICTPQKTFVNHKAYFNRNHFDKSKFKTSNEDHTTCGRNSEFRSISSTKLVRKSVLQKQIESRTRTRKLSLNFTSRGDQRISKYKIVRCTNISNKNTPLYKKTLKRKKTALKFLSDKYKCEKEKKIALLTKRLRKNNKPCPFYNRFGHCKGKERGSCQKQHDPNYITICKRFVQGDCKDDKCTLSHDIRPEKMATCHHYLAGLCKRTDCPYLHIKVNQKAPICRAFLQGFCADVFNCTKRHEYICPTFAEKGSCCRGKSCKLPHRAVTQCSKLLEPNEFPLVNRKDKKKKPQRNLEVSITNKNVNVESSNSCKESPLLQENEEFKPKEFKRYFLAPITVESSD